MEKKTIWYLPVISPYLWFQKYKYIWLSMFFLYRKAFPGPHPVCFIMSVKYLVRCVTNSILDQVLLITSVTILHSYMKCIETHYQKLPNNTQFKVIFLAPSSDLLCSPGAPGPLPSPTDILLQPWCRSLQ